MLEPERNNTDRLWGPADVADYLGVKISTVKKWAQRNQIPSVRAGSLYRFRKADIDRWTETRQQGAA